MTMLSAPPAPAGALFDGDPGELNTPDLKRECIDACKSAGIASSWVQLATNADRRAFLAGGTVPGSTDAPPSTPTPPARVDDSAIRSAVTNAVESALAGLQRITHVHIADHAPAVIDDTKHPAVEWLVTRIARGSNNLMMVGPAGTGKTTAAHHAADALDRPFGMISCSLGMSEYHLFGRMLPDASGQWIYQETPFVRAYRDGGVFLIDEIDAADANLLVALNAALANGSMTNPVTGETIARHPDSVIVAAANTYGRGADRMYAGRNQLDAATLDRFTLGTLHVDYDHDLERRIAAAWLDTITTAALLDWVWTLREHVTRHRLRRVVSTRLIAAAARNMSHGDTLDDIRTEFFADWTEDERGKVGA